MIDVLIWDDDTDTMVGARLKVERTDDDEISVMISPAAPVYLTRFTAGQLAAALAAAATS